MTSEEIAAATGYKTETVNSYLKSATRKLGTANRLEAVADAIRRGIIE
jgi:DNA-binding CsgD family transcriptional regulator